MARYPSGAPVRVTTTVRDTTGTLVDPTTLALTVQKPDGTFITPDYTLAGGAVVRDSLGTFHCDIPAADIAAFGHYPYRWLTTGSGAGVSIGSLDVFDPFEVAVLTLADAKDHLNIAQTTSQYDTLIATWLATITTEIERVIGGPIIIRAITERVTAVNGGTALPLRKKPVVAVTSVTSVTTTTPVGITDIEIDPVANIARRTTGWPFLIPGFGTAWPPVFTVVYTAGLGTAVAPNVSAAARIVLDHLWEIQKGPSMRPALGADDVTTAYGLAFAFPNRALELLGANAVEAYV